MHEIRGEYWINGGHVEFADGDVGDMNHEAIAGQHVLSEFVDNIQDLAKELGINRNLHRFGEIDAEEVKEALADIHEALHDKIPNINQYMMQHIGCNEAAYDILWGGGDPREYVMEHEGWIAIRGMNIELFGYNEEKRKQLLWGLSEILGDEGIEDDVPAEEIEFWLSDHKTNRSHHTTLAELEQPIALRSNVMVQSVKKVAIPTPEKPKVPMVKNKWTKAAQDANIIPPGHDLWRGTSEWIFSEWLKRKSH
jgi:hypothetical protein